MSKLPFLAVALVATTSLNPPVFAQGPAFITTLILLVLALSVSLWSWWFNPERAEELRAAGAFQ